MVKPLVFLLPPLGHDARFYRPLADILSAQCNVGTPDYPYERDFSSYRTEEVLDVLAEYFMEELQTFRKKWGQEAPFLLGGVSLGATLSIRMHRLLDQKPDRIILMAPGGLKVSRARKELIEASLAHAPQPAFVRQAMAIEGSCFEDSAFGRQFCKVSDEVKDYWQYLAQSAWNADRSRVKAQNFITFFKAALDVDYESFIVEDCERYLILWSENDRIFSSRIYKKFQAVAGRSELHLLPHIGHYAPLEDPELIASIFLQTMGLSSEK